MGRNLFKLFVCVFFYCDRRLFCKFLLNFFSILSSFQIVEKKNREKFQPTKQIPETPLFLLSKNRIKDAKKSLCFLRGWTPSQYVAEEFESLHRYSLRSRSCDACRKHYLMCAHPLPTFREKLNQWKRKQTQKPLIIVASLFCIVVFSATFILSTYMIQILTSYNVPMTPKKALELISCVNLLATLTSTCLLQIMSCRSLFFLSKTILLCCSVAICIYGYIVFPRGYSSFPKADLSENQPMEKRPYNFIPFVCIIVAHFCFFCGIYAMPWQIISEAFPYRYIKRCDNRSQILLNLCSEIINFLLQNS